MNPLEKEITRILNEKPNEIYYSGQDLKLLIELISARDEYSIFNDYCHRLGATSGRCINYLEFSWAILERAKKVGASETLKEISDYINNDEIKIEYGHLLYNIHIDEEYSFTNKVKLTRTTSLQDPRLIQFISKDRVQFGGVNSSFLLLDYITPKEYEYAITDGNTDNKKTDWTKINVKTNLLQILDDTRLMLSLSRSPDYGIAVVAGFEIIPESYYFLSNGVGYGPFSEPRTSMGPSIIKHELLQADQLLKKFDLLNDDIKAKLRIAMKRLNDSKIDSNWANKSINLRICLENLFNVGDEYKKTKLLSKRVPAYTNFSGEKVKTIYNFLSTAVHHGVPSMDETISEKEITAELQNVIKRFIEEGGYPDWNN